MPADKPLVAMDDLETVRAWDRIFETLESSLLQEARDGKRSLLVAVAVLVLPTGEMRIATAMDDGGDGEGTAPVSHLVARAKPMLKPGETIKLQIVEVTISAEATWALLARRKRAHGQKSLDDIFDAEWVTQCLKEARNVQNDINVAVAALTLPTGEKRVVFADAELGDGEARKGVASLLRRAKRLKLLRPTEKLERILLKLTLSNTGWIAVGVPDPISSAGVPKRGRSE
jgi:hypothetical protein